MPERIAMVEANFRYRLFRAFFWVHQILFGLPAIIIGLFLWIETIQTIFKLPIGSVKASADELTAAMVFLLAWIGGTLMWGLAALLYRQES
jgi:hypothetical protein